MPPTIRMLSSGVIDRFHIGTVTKGSPFQPLTGHRFLVSAIALRRRANTLRGARYRFVVICAAIILAYHDEITPLQPIGR